jgi:hypothetical protein
MVKGFIEIERLSAPTGKGPGLHEIVAYSGTKENITGVIGHGRARSGAGIQRLLKKLQRMVK